MAGIWGIGSSRFRVSSSWQPQDTEKSGLQDQPSDCRAHGSEDKQLVGNPKLSTPKSQGLKWWVSWGKHMAMLAHCWPGSPGWSREQWGSLLVIQGRVVVAFPFRC